MNKVYILGRITRELELKYYGDDLKPYLQFCVAINKFNRKDKTPSADFIDIVAFGKKAEIISKNFVKGNLISLEAHLTNNNYLDQSRVKRYSTKVILDDFQFVTKKEAIAK